MAVVVVAEFGGGDQGFYEEVSGKAMPDHKLPDGARIHIAGPIEGGWRVITLWDSEEQFTRFRDERLVPVMEETGHGERVTPNITVSPVHRVLDE